MKGVSLINHMRYVETETDAYDFIIAMLDLLSMLERSYINHRDITEFNIIFNRREDDTYSVVLVDFTWAYSPTVKGMFPPPSFLNRFHRPSDAINLVRSTGQFNAEDVYSVGSLIQDMLIMYTNVDISRWARLFDAMKSKCNILDCANLALDLLVTYDNTAPTTSPSTESSFSDVDKERQIMCNQPNIFAGVAEVEMRLVPDLGGSSYTEARQIRTAGYQAFQITYQPPDSVKLLPLSSKLQEESNVLVPILSLVAKDMTILDIGGNYGYFSALSVAYGAKAATIVDMDTTYTRKATEIYSFLGPLFSDRIHVQNKKLSQMDDDSADIVIALALIHWSFNCSESAGNLARTVGRLAWRAKLFGLC